jgi:hypothetical protein
MGGHGRKFPILFAGAMLHDSHMLEVGTWDTRFQDVVRKWGSEMGFGNGVRKWGVVWRDKN